MNAYGKRAAALHLSYVERDGVEQDGSKGRLYSGAEVSDAQALLSAPLENEKRQFRFIVSPEDAAEVDLTAFTRRLMAQVQADLGRALVWGAVNHWNTDNPHVHVIVRGIDEAGRDVTIDGRYLAEGMRSRAQAILTNELGPRTELDVQDQLAREVRQERFTSLDRALQESQDPSGALLETSLPRQRRASAPRFMARLGRLEQLGLVTRASAIGWSFARGGSRRCGVSGRRTTSSSGSMPPRHSPILPDSSSWTDRSCCRRSRASFGARACTTSWAAAPSPCSKRSMGGSSTFPSMSPRPSG